jgi:CheY-like chemotaxis protein
MLDHEDLKWLAAVSTELNTNLQQVSRYADLVRQHKGEYNYIELLSERVELASKIAQSLFDRVTSRILEGSAANKKGSPDPLRPPEFTIVPAPSEPAPAKAMAKLDAATAGVRPIGTEAGTSPARPARRNSIPADIRVLNAQGARELILFVEDEAEIAQLASEMLADEGYRVIMARDGFEAMRIYQQISEQIGLVILDFFLPVMNGDAVFDELRALNPNVAVVLSSGFDEPTKLGNMLAQGLRGFVPKPYTREKLLEQVRSTLDAPRDSVR